MSKKNAPHPEDPRKPDSISEITRPSWKFVLRSTMREFVEDGLMDMAAGLTYFGVLSIFPAIVAMVSIFNLAGQDPRMISDLLDQLRGVIPQEQMATIEEVVVGLLQPKGAGLGLVLGLLVALWSASNYVKAFGRAMNRVYEAPEGRPIVRYYVHMYVLTALLLITVAIAVVLALVSGPVAEAIGALIGLGETAVTVWDIAKWPVMAVLAMLMVSVLYWATPNVQQPKFRWVSVGGVVALVLAALASLGFGFYVANFGNYDATYGTLAGVIIFLFWLWIINIVILFGAELDAELERARELQGGIAAEVDIQLPLRDTRVSDKAAQRREADVELARGIRERAQAEQDAHASFTRHDPAESPSGRRYGSSPVERVD